MDAAPSLEARIEAGAAEHEFAMALSRLYGKDKYEPRVKIKTRPSNPKRMHEQKMAETRRQKAPKKYEPPRRKQKAVEMPAPIHFVRGRKPAERIRADVAREFPAPPPPVAATSSSSSSSSANAAPKRQQYMPDPDFRKRDLQDKMRRRGGRNALLAEQPVDGRGHDDDDGGIDRAQEPGRRRPAMRARRADTMPDDQVLFDQIMDEIDDRRRFLNEMQALGEDKAYRAQVTKEIAERVEQLKTIDDALRRKENRH